MKYSSLYYGRKIRQLQEKLNSAEREIEQLKKLEKTVRIDEKQVNNFFLRLSDQMDLNSYDIVNEIKSATTKNQKNNRIDIFSSAIKIGLAILFIGFGILLALALIQNGAIYWAMNLSYKIALIFMWIVVIDCIALGIDIFKETDRNYIIALFSALVALVALIVTLVK